MSQQEKPYPLRLDPGLKAWLAERAKISRRSLNSEIHLRLEDSRSQEKEKTQEMKA